MVQWSRVAVLQLYKSLLRRGYKDLRFTDKDYYRNLVQEEFKKNKYLTTIEDKQKQLDKGTFFLENKYGKLI